MTPSSVCNVRNLSLLLLEVLLLALCFAGAEGRRYHQWPDKLPVEPQGKPRRTVKLDDLSLNKEEEVDEGLAQKIEYKDRKKVIYKSEPECMLWRLMSFELQFYRFETSPGKYIKSMELVYKVSDSDCVKNRTFGFTATEVTVSNGCDGAFKICHFKPDYLCIREQIANENRKVWPGKFVTEIKLNKKLHGECNTADFNFDKEKVWTKNGCCATFDICLHNVRECPIQRLGSQLFQPVMDVMGAGKFIHYMALIGDPSSHSECTWNKTYGYLGPEATVSDGCVGRFLICFYRNGEKTPKEGRICVRETISSEDKKKMNPIIWSGKTITDVFLHKCHSKHAKCYNGKNVKMDGERLIVTNGCRGTFDICLRGEF